jgi:hypothetical protein
VIPSELTGAMKVLSAAFSGAGDTSAAPTATPSAVLPAVLPAVPPPRSAPPGARASDEPPRGRSGSDGEADG